MSALVEDTDEAKLWAAGKRILALEEELGRLRVALANLVDRDFTYQGEHVASGQIPRGHIYEGRKALNAKHLK